MLCKKCGAQVLDGIKFCPNCGSSMEEVVTPNIVNNNVNQVESLSESYSTVSVGSVVQPTMTQGQPIQGQPVNNYSQPMNSYNQPMGTPNNGQKKNTGLIALIAVIAVAVLVCIIIIANSSNKNNNSNSNSNNPSNIPVISNSNLMSNVVSNTTSNAVSNTISNVTSNAVSNTTAGNTVSFQGYKLQIPSNYKVVSATSQLQLMGTNNVDVAVISIQSGSYDSLKLSSATIKTTMQNSGYTVGKIEIDKKYNNVNFITAEVSQNGKNMILAYAKLSSDKVFMVVYGNTSYTLDYSKLNTFATMVSTAKAE